MAPSKAGARSLLALVAFFAGTYAAMSDGLRDRSPSTTSAAPESIVLFSGSDSAKDSNYLFQGAIVALNGDIGRDGFVLRAYGSHVDYEYNNGGTRTTGIGWQGDLMIGYLVSRGPIWAAAYIGLDYQQHRLTPDDPTNAVRGTELGFKVVADMASLRTEGPVYFSLSGNYSTAFDSYWTRARVGANLPRLTIGPEFIALGNKGFDATRVGGFVTFDLPITKKLPLEVTLSLGHQFAGGSNSGTTGAGGGEGTYFGISLTSLF